MTCFKTIPAPDKYLFFHLNAHINKMAKEEKSWIITQKRGKYEFYTLYNKHIPLQ